MDTRYKVVLSNHNMYKEVELSPNYSQIRVGTHSECDSRLRRELFFDAVELIFTRNSQGEWSVICSDNIYLSVGDIRKLVTTPLRHGSEFVAKYQNSDSDVFNLSFFIDFDYEEKAYDYEIDISGRSQIAVGGDDNCQIRLNSPYVGRDTFVIGYENGQYVLHKSQTKYGIYLNGYKNGKQVVLQENDFISLADFSFCFRAGKLYTTQKDNLRIIGLNARCVNPSTTMHQYPKFNRNTRIKSVLPTEPIKVLDPPAAPQKPSGNIVMRLLPAIIMFAMTVVLRGMMSSSGGAYVWMSVISMGIGLVTSIVGIMDERKKYKTASDERRDTYTKYIGEKEALIQTHRQEETQLLEDTYYSIDREISMVDNFSANLFNRKPTDEDFAEIRLGTGRNKAIRVVDYKRQETFEPVDELTYMPEKLADKYAYIDQVPITLNLQNKSAVGFVGNRNALYGMLKNITLDMAARHYYTELGICYILGEETGDQFNWLRLLPHVNNELLQSRNIVCDTDSKNLVFEYLYKELSRRETEKCVHPRIVVFVFEDMGIKRHPISRYMEHAASLGVSFLFFEEYEEFIPSGCSDVVYLRNNGSGEVVNAEDKTNIRSFAYTEVSDETAARMVRKLAPVYCEEVSLEGSLTKSISMFEMLNILNVDDIDLEANWKNSAIYKSMAAPLGVKSKNQIVYLDLNEKKHGPHGLVAGTTGSGKSEIIQTYILSMATLFHPYEVGFVIIDFKGGGMVNQFEKLPHLIGAITNIDGREINRSLLSIKAELRKRQELFAQYKVNHIDAYIKLFKKGQTPIPLPHLILVVDEFAELKLDQPEFMKELISAARIGRSLGVHLILATQKPSGVVDPQIWSNSKFKLCLKVQNKEDSNEVLKTPLAAEIKEPGRAYLQVGNNEIFDLFQSAYSGASASADAVDSPKSFVIEEVDLSGRSHAVYTRKVEKTQQDTQTQLEAIVEYVAEHCAERGIKRLPGICLPPLADVVDYVQTEGVRNDVSSVVTLGVYDDPDSQYQGEVSIDLLESNTVIIGSSQYGKTNLLQTMLRGIASNYSPDEINVYILDFGSMALKVFDSMNHVGGVIVAAEDEKLKNLMRMVRMEMKHRKEVFSKLGITSFASYKEAGKTDMPHIVIMVDNFLGLKELYSEYEEDILSICREGVAVGVSLVITSLQSNGISYKYMSNFANRIALYCNSSDEYSSIFDKCRMQPKNVPGRGLVSINKHIFEYQSYRAFEGEKEIERVARIKEFLADIDGIWRGKRAKRIPEVPKLLDMNYVVANMDLSHLHHLQVPVGIDYDSVELVTVDLNKTPTIGITGREGFGRTNLAKRFVHHLQIKVFDTPSKVYILDDYEKQLDCVSSYGVVERYSINLEDVEEILNEIESELQMRLRLVQEEGVEVLKDLPLIMVVGHNSGLFATDGMNKKSLDALKRILKTYRNMKVCFLFANIDNVPGGYGASEMTKMVKEYACVFAMEDIANLKVVETGQQGRKFKKLLELGDAYMITDKGISRQKIIHMKED